MIEGPYSSVDLSYDGRFMHLSSSFVTSTSCSSSSSSSSSSPLSPSSTSPSSLADSLSAFSKYSHISERPPCSTSSSKLSFYHSPRTDISGVSSATSFDLTPPCSTFPAEWNEEAYNFTAKSSWPSGSESKVAVKHTSNLQRQASAAPPLPKEQLQNPRRTKRLLETPSRLTPDSCNEPQACPLPPPSLVRQTDRKVNFVDNLVDTAAQIVEAIWPSSMVYKASEPSLGRVLPLRTFIQETLRRSRTSYSTLQVALYYLFVIRPFVPTDDANSIASDMCHDARALQCGRRMFLAALILASKYLQDKNYSARAWSKISGLNINEINANEMAFLSAVNWRLHISDCIFDKWTKIVLKCTPTTSIIPANSSAAQCRYPTNKWIPILSQLDMSLDSNTLDRMLSEVDCSPATPPTRPLVTSGVDSTARSCLNNGMKMSSMAFALASPCGGQAICTENMPVRCVQICDDRNTNRAIRKSSLSMCETVDTCESASAILDGPILSSLSTNLYNRFDTTRAQKSCQSNIVIDSRQRIQNGSRGISGIEAPAREQILGQTTNRPEPRRLASAPSTISIPESLVKSRKRGNETPVAARHQKKQKDKLGDFTSQKPQELAPSGLTPQMRQMSTNFSVSGKKGNGLRMNINPGFALPGSHGQVVRPAPGQRSTSNVVYG